MKILIGIVCFVLISLAEAQAIKECIKLQINLATKGNCSSENTTNACRDFCTGEDIISKDDCENATHCCFVNNTCILKTTNFRPIKSNLQFELELETAFQLPYTKATTSVPQGTQSSIQGRYLQLGNLPPGNQIPPQGGYPQLCPKFPYNCPTLSFGNPSAFVPPVNIPYCQRIACSPLNPSLDLNPIACLGRPGCYFDFVLHQYRKVLFNVILPGIPVCHLAIRNEAFQRRASRTQQQLKTWNPYLTECLLKEYRDEIYGESVGCELLDLFEYFGHYPKRAGWPNINEASCRLINGCWRRTKGERFCAYPLRNRHFNVRSGNEERSINANKRNLYGIPSCMPFSSNLKGGDFLTSYHQCLSIGCAIDVDSSVYWINLYQAGSTLPQHLQPFYHNMIRNNKVTHQNFKSVIEQILKQYSWYPPFSNNFGFGNQQQPIAPLIPFSLNVNRSNVEKRSLSFGPNNFFSQPGSSNNGGTNYPTDPSLPYYPTLPLTPPQATCPYLYQPLPGFPSLTGSFEGCCEKSLCFVPREQLYRTYSGIASYFHQWSNWGVCSVSCGGGRKNRTRSCVGDGCDKRALRIQHCSCNNQMCPYYRQWSAYAPCSTTCGVGTRSRSRICSEPGKCRGEEFETISCSTATEVCPACGQWNRWSECIFQSNKDCGTGQEKRTRICPKGRPRCCPEDEEQTRPCNVICYSYQLICDPSTCYTTQQCVEHPAGSAECPSTPPTHIPQICSHSQCRGSCLWYSIQCNNLYYGG